MSASIAPPNRQAQACFKPKFRNSKAQAFHLERRVHGRAQASNASTRALMASFRLINSPAPLLARAVLGRRLRRHKGAAGRPGAISTALHTLIPLLGG